MCLGGLVVGHAAAWELIQTFLAARFSGAERHRRRLAKVTELEGKTGRFPGIARLKCRGKPPGVGRSDARRLAPNASRLGEDPIAPNPLRRVVLDSPD
jgi:hypothetical protein